MDKNDSGSTVAGGGVGIAGLLGVAFVVLKLTETIDWPWIWVLSPFWIPLALGLTVVFVLLIWLIFITL